MEMTFPLSLIPEASSASAHPFWQHALEGNSKEQSKIVFAPLLMKSVIV
jgi:hypothetical protein